MPATAPDEICSLDFDCGRFPPHGEFRVRHDHGVLHWVNRGPFNVEAFRQYEQARAAALERWQLAGRSIAGLVEWRHSALMSADAFNTYSAGFERYFATRGGLRAVAWVAAPELEGMAIMVRHFGELFERHHLPFRVFEDLAPAREWVRQVLATFDGSPAG